MRLLVHVGVVALLVIAGCTGGVSEPSTQPSPTTADSTTQASTTEQKTTATPYPDEMVAFPAGPKERPELPDTLTAETASAYAKRHEFRYSYNDLWAGPGTEVGMSAEHSCSVDSIEQRGHGYLVTVRCTGYVNQLSSGSESTRTQHADLPPWTVRYYIDENSVLREEVE